MYYVGKKTSLQTSLDVSSEYKNLSEKDLQAANLLMINGLYNEAYYYFIQSMEKNIKKRICEIVDITNPFFANQMRDIGHSLDNAIEFLLRLISGNNEVMYEQIKNQIVEGVLKGVKFSSVHNNVRYPYYNPHKKEYVYLEITREDCYEIQQMEKKLKVFLNELHRI